MADLLSPYLLYRTAEPLMGIGGPFEAAQQKMGQGAMPMMSPEAARRMMESPAIRQMLGQWGLAPNEDVRTSPFFGQAFMQRHPKIGGPLSSSLENMAMTPQPTGPEGFGGGMQRFAQGMAGGPEMQRRYEVGQILAPMQGMGMMMPGYGAQQFGKMVSTLGDLAGARAKIEQEKAEGELATKKRAMDIKEQGMAQTQQIMDARQKLYEAQQQLAMAKSVTEQGKYTELLSKAQANVANAEAAKIRADMAAAKSTQNFDQKYKAWQGMHDTLTKSPLFMMMPQDKWTPQMKDMYKQYETLGQQLGLIAPLPGPDAPPPPANPNVGNPLAPNSPNPQGNPLGLTPPPGK